MNTVVSKDGTAIAYDRSGDGPAVVLVGGAFQYRSFDPSTRHLAALLSTGFTVYHYDRRGRGDSGDTAPYSVEREIEDLDALVAAAGGTACVFGMSSGAALALDAVAAGVPVTKLALYEAPFVVDDSRPPLPADYLARLNGLVSSGRRADAVELFLTVAVGVPTEFVASMRQSPMWSGFEAVAHTLPYDGAIMGTTMSGKPLPADRWARVTVPALVADGGASAPGVHRAAEALAEILPAATRRTLDGQDHAVAPDVLAPVLAEFFAP
jgi:pimeloyl-ACP methyl ester carboxylesterase